jgi:hypothetical protein
MVAVVRVVVALFRRERRILSDVVLGIADRDGRHAGLRQREVIGSEEVASARLDVASQRAALCLRDRREHRPESRSLRAQHRQVRRRAEDVQAVDVDVGRKLIDWHHRMPGEVLRAEQPDSSSVVAMK